MVDTSSAQPSRLKPLVLLILDGWGIGPNTAGNAIMRAKTPNISSYFNTYPHTQLAASGKAVGLPHSEDGNTETGHLNIGAGRIVYQDLPRINMAIADGTFAQDRTLLSAIEHVKEKGSRLHLMGLVGSGGVHSNIEHLYALLNLAKHQGLTDNVNIHVFTDGRDSPPTSGINYIRELTDKCRELDVGRIASIMGRYYAMDRDHRWERTQRAYDVLTLGTPESCITDPFAWIEAKYSSGVTDEFLEPVVVCDSTGQKHLIQDHDAVIFFNYRIDRPRQLTKAFVLPDFEQGTLPEGFDPYAVKYEKSHIAEKTLGPTFTRQKIIQDLFFVTMTQYEADLPVHVAFPPQVIINPLGEVLAKAGLKQLRMAETEKERFVTYYFNGLHENPYPGEDRQIIPSKKVATYDLAPEMSVQEITTHMLQHIEQNTYDVIIANIANADMVAHTGNLQATIQACEIVDECVGKIVGSVLEKNGVVLITADHGNAEELINNETGEIDTEHSIYPVPLIIIGKGLEEKSKNLPSGILGDIAPTMLSLLKLEKPPEMTGRELM